MRRLTFLFFLLIALLLPKHIFPAQIGEKITYDVKLGALRLGKAYFNRMRPIEMNGGLVNLMTFETNLARFKDLETIYSDPDTFLPLKIERTVRAWSKREQITEDYDQKEFTLTIIKRNGRKTEQVSIKKDKPIHNTILLPFHVRNIPKLDIGWVFPANLPTQEFQIKLVAIDEVKVPAGIFKSYHFKSTPRKFEIWISADERRIPLKIKGAGGFGYTLEMREYSL